MVMPEIVATALRKVVKNPEEFIAPGISRYREDYRVLRQLYDELDEKLNEHGKRTGSYQSVRIALKGMVHHIIEAEDGYAFFPIDTDRILRELAFLEKYFLYKTINR